MATLKLVQEAAKRAIRMYGKGGLRGRRAGARSWEASLALNKSLSRSGSEGEGDEWPEEAGLTVKMSSYEDGFGRKCMCTCAFKKKREGCDGERWGMREKLFEQWNKILEIAWEESQEELDVWGDGESSQRCQLFSNSVG